MGEESRGIGRAFSVFGRTLNSGSVGWGLACLVVARVFDRCFALRSDEAMSSTLMLFLSLLQRIRAAAGLMLKSAATRAKSIFGFPTKVSIYDYKREYYAVKQFCSRFESDRKIET